MLGRLFQIDEVCGPFDADVGAFCRLRGGHRHGNRLTQEQRTDLALRKDAAGFHPSNDTPLLTPLSGKLSRSALFDEPSLRKEIGYGDNVLC